MAKKKLITTVRRSKQTAAELQQTTSTLEDTTREIDELKQEILKLRTRNTQKVASDKIQFFGLDDKGKNFAVECKISDANSTDKSKCIVFGRPPIAESATKQQRHITPYSFLESIVDKYTTGLFYATVEESRVQLLQLIPPLKTLVSFTSSGLGFTKQAFEELQAQLKTSDKEQDVQTWLQITTKLGLYNRDYYLVHKSISSFIPQNLSKDKLLSAQQLYQDKMVKLLDYTISELSNDIISYDSLIFINQELIKLVLILFNTRSNISLPNDKWHNLDYSIRLYDNKSDAKKDKDTGFRTVTSDELYNIATDKQQTNIDERIRIVKDEGSVVKATIESLKKISEIAKSLNDDLYENARTQLASYNKLVKERKVLQEYKKQLTLPDLATNTTQDQKTVALNIMTKLYEENIPSHLYHVFDLKPLEKKVFVPFVVTQSHKNYWSVYVKGKDTTQRYCFQNREDYVDNTAPPSSSRPEKNTKFLVHKVVDHVVTSILGFFNFEKGHSNNLKLLEAFSKKITDLSTEYHVKKEEYKKEFNEYYKEYDIFNVVSSDDDTVSEVIGATIN